MFKSCQLKKINLRYKISQSKVRGIAYLGFNPQVYDISYPILEVYSILDSNSSCHKTQIYSSKICNKHNHSTRFHQTQENRISYSSNVESSFYWYLQWKEYKMILQKVRKKEIKACLMIMSSPSSVRNFSLLLQRNSLRVFSLKKSRSPLQGTPFSFYNRRSQYLQF